MEKFGEDIHHIPTRPKVINADMLNFAPMFEFLLPNHIFPGAPKLLDLTFKAPPISYNLTKFHGNRPRELGDFAPK